MALRELVTRHPKETMVLEGSWELLTEDGTFTWHGEGYANLEVKGVTSEKDRCGDPVTVVRLKFYHSDELGMVTVPDRE